MSRLKYIVIGLLPSILLSCNKINEFNQEPELTSLEQGFKASAAIGFCASVASTAFSGGNLPDYVDFNKDMKDGYTGAGIITIHFDSSNPLPFNKNVGDVVIAGLWNGSSGVISILFANINVFTSQFKFYGIYTVPVIKKADTGDLIAIFAEQDIIIGEGSDTIINLSLSRPKFDLEIERSESSLPPLDPFVAVKQNFWHITIDQNNTPSDFYDDKVKVSGGGQIAEVTSNSGGILYHALIETKFSYSTCGLNPTSGTAFIQNIKAGSTIDLGNITLDFHTPCDGKANVLVATGKYVGSNGKNINLGWN